MSKNKWMIAGPLLAALLMTVACAEQQATAADQPDAAERLARDARRAIAEINKDDLAELAFKKETVIKLNAIVERSVDALEKFDKLVPMLVEARESGDAARVAELAPQFTALEQQAETARTDFQTEKEALLARKERHNDVILATMEQFVVEAPGEIADAIGQQAN